MLCGCGLCKKDNIGFQGNDTEAIAKLDFTVKVWSIYIDLLLYVLSLEETSLIIMNLFWWSPEQIKFSMPNERLSNTVEVFEF